MAAGGIAASVYFIPKGLGFPTFMCCLFGWVTGAGLVMIFINRGA